MLRFDPTPYDILGGLARWGIVLGLFLAVAMVVSFFVAVATVGFRRAPREMWGHLKRGFGELVLVSPRRVWAITQLVIRESIRRKALLVFVVFALLFMFGSWFMTSSGERPELQASVHINFVLKTVAFLTIPVVLLLACWGLPQDIKQRSLHTVVTKPARRSEVVMGRILGFSAIGTLILAVMGFIGYFWIIRQVPPEAQSQLVSRVPIYGSLEFTNREGNPGKGVNTGDIWEFRSYIEGASKASAIWTFDDVTPAKLVAVEERNPITGKMETRKVLQLESHFEAFRTWKGTMGQGLLVQFKFLKDLRTQIAHLFTGNSEFQQLSDLIAQGNFADAGRELRAKGNGLKLKTGGIKASEEMYDAFRLRFRRLAHIMEPFADGDDFESAGEFVSAANAASQAARDRDKEALAAQFDALGQLFQEHSAALSKHIVNLQSESSPFEVREYKVNIYDVPRTLENRSEGSEASQKENLDLFDDLTHGGELRVAVFCLDPGQYVGMARPDLFIRTPDRKFYSGYSKAVGGIWMMLVLVVVLGVTASTFVKGPVATLLTFTLILVGLSFHPFLQKLVTDLGGKGYGAIESMVRIVEHKNPTVQLEDSRPVYVMKATDKVILAGMWTVYQTVPNFNVYSLGPYVANGFDVPFDAGLLPAIAMTLAYLLPCIFIGYFSLRLRELEAK